MASLFAGTQLINKENAKFDPEGLSKCEKIVLFFSSNWCPDCQPFSPVLAEFYDEINADDKKMEVVYISSDETEEKQLSYMKNKHADWLALPVADPLTKALKQKFGTFAGKEQASMGDVERVNGIPSVVVLNPDASFVAGGDAVCDAIVKKGPRVYDSW